MFVTILSYILVMALGGCIGVVIATLCCVKEIETFKKAHEQYANNYKDLLNLAIKRGRQFEDRCEELEMELDHYKNGGDVNHE